MIAFIPLIRHFIARQALVREAISELAPHLLGHPYDPNVLIPQSGIWHGEWRHWRHGIGCRLTHILTGEILEWDAPDVQAFRFEWFWQHLEWRAAAEGVDMQRWEYDAVYSGLLDHGLMTIGRDGICRLA